MGEQQKKPDADSGSTPPVLSSEEQRVTAQRLTDLANQASTAVAEANEAKSAAAALRGDLERANLELVGLRAANERLSSSNQALVDSTAAREGLPALPVDLPKGAFQLVESVTISVMGDNGKPVRAVPKRGDVVVVGRKDEDLEDLQAEIGQVARVYAIDRSIFEELKALKHLR